MQRMYRSSSWIGVVFETARNVEGNALMGIAAEAANLKIEVTRVERVTQGR